MTITRNLAGIALALSLAGAPAVAAEEEAEEGVSLRVVAKTATYQVMSATNELLYGVIYGGGLAAGGALFGASLMIEPLLYYTHETLWRGLLSQSGMTESETLPLRASTYTVANMGRTFVTGWLVTGSPVLAAGFVAFNAVGDAAAYTVNDVGWNVFAPPGEPTDTRLAAR